MPLVLNLGVMDLPYSTPPSTGPKPAKPNSVSTGDVAGWLEGRYHPMEHFYQFSQEKIAEHVAESLAGALESIAMGAPVDSADTLLAAASAIDADFKQFLALDTLSTLGYPGLPTKAALDGVNHRLKAKRIAGAKRRKGFIGPRMPARPSLIDTGTYQAAFKAWFDAT